MSEIFKQSGGFSPSHKRRGSLAEGSYVVRLVVRGVIVGIRHELLQASQVVSPDREMKQDRLTLERLERCNSRGRGSVTPGKVFLGPFTIVFAIKTFDHGAGQQAANRKQQIFKPGFRPTIPES